MTARRSNTANAWETTLTSQMAPTDLTAVVATTTGGPASPCYLVIEPDKAGTQLEIIYFDGTFTGTTFVTSGIGNRYLTGSAAASGLTHPVGSKVRSVPVKQLMDDVFDYIETKFSSTGGTMTGLLVLSGDGTAQLNPVSLRQWQTRDPKDSVRAATTAALAAGTYAAGVFTVTASAALAAQDGVTLIAGDRLLVKNQVTGSQNGIYTVTTVGDGSHQAVLTRATDFDTSAKVTAAAVCKVEEGTVNLGTEWFLSTTGTITLDSTSLTFKQSSSLLGVAQGDIIYFDGTNWKILPKSTDGLYLKLASGIPSWATSFAVVPAIKTRTSGTITLNSTAWADLDNTTFDVTLAAATGDYISYSLSGRWVNDASFGCLDVATIVSSSPVNYLSGGAGTGTSQGVMAWQGISGVQQAFGGTILYAVQAGDISGGNVTLRLRYRTIAAVNKGLNADADARLTASVVNLKH